MGGGAVNRCCPLELWLSRRRRALSPLSACRVGLLLAVVGVCGAASDGHCIPCRLPHHTVSVCVCVCVCVCVKFVSPLTLPGPRYIPQLPRRLCTSHELTTKISLII